MFIRSRRELDVEIFALPDIAEWRHGQALASAERMVWPWGSSTVGLIETNTRAFIKFHFRRRGVLTGFAPRASCRYAASFEHFYCSMFAVWYNCLSYPPKRRAPETT